ncbi:MAG: YigZ family protein, partial [Lachnospiraceae bacterium]|nr:YigZ family protein [Lachnospiraceae bacterium]
MENNKKQFLPYKIVYSGGEGEIIEKKSRFIAAIAPAESEEEALAFIESVRKKHYDARHNCPAF